MSVPGSLIVPDPRPPSVFLLGAGALLLAGLVIRTLRRRRGRATRQGASRSSSQGTLILGSWRPVAAALPVPVARARVEEGAQKRGRAAKKRP